MAEFAVVTRVCEPETGGNLAAAFELYSDNPEKQYGDDGKFSPIPLQLALVMRAPVFHVGEILILDDSGREISYPGRKPSKWDVEVHSCETLEEAIRLVHDLEEADIQAHEIMREHERD
jgi:hypothetical protein